MIGRDDVIHEILQGDWGGARAGDLCGSLGVGKTSLLEHVNVAATEQRPVLLRLQDYDPGHHGQVGPDASVGAVQASFHHFTRLLSTLLSAAGPPESEHRFAGEVTDAYNAEVLGQRVYSIDESVRELVHGTTPADLAEAWRDACHVVQERFLEHWNSRTGGPRRMLLLDNSDYVADQELGGWLAGILPRMGDTVAVLGREPQGPRIPLEDSAWREFRLDNFTVEEVRDYLAQEVPGSAASEAVVQEISKVTAGHPATLAVVAKLIWADETTPSAPPEELLQELQRQQHGEQVAWLAERLVDRTGGRHLARALDAAAVTRSLTADLLQHLLTDPPLPEDGEVATTFTQLERLPFVERPCGDKDSLCLRSFVRNSLLDRMFRLRRKQFAALHARVADYYNEALHPRDGEEGAATYLDAFSSEDPVWQKNKREWLYHSGFVSRERRTDTLLEFARVYFDALWWWGNYVHFDFCDELVADLGQLAQRHGGVPDASGTDPGQGEAEDRRWDNLVTFYSAVRDVHQGYPLRAVKPREADWAAVRDALLQVQDVCGLQAEADIRRSPVAKHVAALINVFLAHTWRYQAGDVKKADKYYTRAAALFAGDNEWSPGWVFFERADLRLQGGDRSTVSGLWWEAAKLAQPLAEGGSSDEDEELASNLHRLRADCAWPADRTRAAEWYGRAALHAYLFHFTGGPEFGAPDFYTLQFYVDIRARAIRRLYELVEAGEVDAAVGCAVRMSTVVMSALGRAPAADDPQLRGLVVDPKEALHLALRLFPRGPLVSELEDKKSDFARDFRSDREEVDWAWVRRDLHDPVWP